MKKKYSVLLGVDPFINGEELFPNASIVNDILFIALFTSIGIEILKPKTNMLSLHLV